MTGEPAANGFLRFGLLSAWVLLYGVLRPVLQRRHDMWLAIVLIMIPFWLRNLTNYFLPDLMHAALCMLYLGLLRRRQWGLAAAMLTLMFLERESTLLIALVAVPSRWWLGEDGQAFSNRRDAGGDDGFEVCSAARPCQSTPHQRHPLYDRKDSLECIEEYLWHHAVDQYSTVSPPLRIWHVPNWLPLGGIHRVGYSEFSWLYPMVTAIAVLTSFGLGSLVSVWLALRTPLRTLLPREEPYLCVAGVYGAVAFVIAPMVGAALPRLIDYGWPLFLVYLPAMIPRVWRNWPVWTVSLLVLLHLICAWTEMIRLTFLHFSFGCEFAVLIGCNLVRAIAFVVGGDHEAEAVSLFASPYHRSVKDYSLTLTPRAFILR